MLQRDAAAVRAQQLVERAQALGAAVDVLAARGLTGVAVRFEGRDDRGDVAGRERALVLGHDARLAQLGVARQQRRADRVPAGEWPAAVVDPQLVEPLPGEVVGDERERQIHAAALAVDVQDDLLEAALLEDDALDVLDRDVPLREPPLISATNASKPARP